MKPPGHIVAASDFPLGSHRAHAINVVKTAGGFLRLGHAVTLLCASPEDADADPRELPALYGEPALRVEFLDPGVSSEARSAPARAAAFGDLAARRAAQLSPVLVYARHFEAALASRALGLPTVLETHSHAGDARAVVLGALAGTRHGTNPLRIATISPALRDDYAARGADPARIGLVPDGVDPDLFSRADGPSPFQDGAPNIVYSGHLYDYKGIPTILAAAALAPRWCWRLLGGLEEDSRRVRERVAREGLANVVLHASVPHAQVPRFLLHADVLLLPPSADHPSAAWTSPVKLGEYLASGRPIVASRIPGLTTWVDAPAVRWFTPDDPRDLVARVEECLGESPSHRVARTQAAADLTRRFSYASRAAALLALGRGEDAASCRSA